MLVVAVITFDPYLFLAFSDLTRPNLEVETKRLLHQEVKILG